MKQSFFYLTLSLLFWACNQHDTATQEQLKTEIFALEKKLLDTGDASKDKSSALLLIEKTKQYAKHFPQDSLTPELLFKAGDVAKGAREYGKAIHLWGQVWRNYGAHDKASIALFLQGFTFDSDLRDPKMASRYYKDFLTRYPNDPLADQVKQLLAVVELNPEELVRQFEEQGK
jgi:outer membrane protein assembly factor BamD (BamD/ComL family)